jgi:hypothetical protein
MDSQLDHEAAPWTEPDVEEEIEVLMAQPIKAQPAVTIFGDDDVVGFNPPKAKSA